MMSPKQALVIALTAGGTLAVVWGVYCSNADAIDAAATRYAAGWIYQTCWVLLLSVLTGLTVVSSVVLVRDAIRQHWG